MKKNLILLFIGLTTLIYGQKSKVTNFDIVDFNKKMEVAEWLYEYDMIAWRTSDSVMRMTCGYFYNSYYIGL